MNRYEEELQRDIEAGLHTTADDADVKAYREVFRALGTPPQTSLSHHFADKIVARIEQKRKQESEKDLFWLGAGIGVMVLALVATMLYTGFKFDLGFLKEMPAYTGLLIFGIGFVALLTILEKKVLLKKEIK